MSAHAAYPALYLDLSVDTEGGAASLPIKRKFAQAKKS